MPLLVNQTNYLEPRSHCPGVRHGASRQFAAGGPVRIGKEFECVPIDLAVLRTRPGLGQKLITVCPGNATVCETNEFS